MSLYILDANVFIEAKRYTYPFDVFPGFWEWLDQEYEKKNLLSIKPIYDELTAGDDDLSQWTKERKDTDWFVKVDDEETQKNYSKIASWAVDPANNFKNTAYEDFLNVADSWIVAKAISENATVVTHEVYQENCKKRILIPNVCRAFGVPYINTIELIRKTGARFGLRK